MFPFPAFTLNRQCCCIISETKLMDLLKKLHINCVQKLRGNLHFFPTKFTYCMTVLIRLDPFPCKIVDVFLWWAAEQSYRYQVLQTVNLCSGIIIQLYTVRPRNTRPWAAGTLLYATQPYSLHAQTALSFYIS